MAEGFDFRDGQLVRFNSKALNQGVGEPGSFTIAKVIPIPPTCLDPFSDEYQGGREGQDAVGHHQVLILKGRDGAVSGAFLEPVVQTA